MGGVGTLTPDLSVDTDDRLAGLNVEDLEVESEVDTGLTLGDILADVLSGNVVWTLGNLRGENTGAVAGEESGLRGGEIVVLCGQVRHIQVANITSYNERIFSLDLIKGRLSSLDSRVEGGGGGEQHIQLSREMPLFSAIFRARASRRLMLRASRPRALILAEQWERLFLVCWR